MRRQVPRRWRLKLPLKASGDIPQSSPTRTDRTLLTMAKLFSALAPPPPGRDQGTGGGYPPTLSDTFHPGREPSIDNGRWTLSRLLCLRRVTPFRANDCLRLDGHKDAVSLSIAHPNDRMFAKYRWQDLQQKWAVLVLDPSILWLLPTAFNRHNAADKRMSSLSATNGCRSRLSTPCSCRLTICLRARRTSSWV